MNIKSKALLAYVVIFLVGGASGYLLNEAVSPELPTDRFERGRGMSNDFSDFGEGDVPQRIKNFMIDRLDLRDEQVDPFFEIQSEHMKEVFSVIGEHRSSEMDTLRQMYAGFIDDVDEVLTAEQIKKLNSFAHPDSVRKWRMQHRRQGRRW
ncbi:MAG: hypothetical protein U5K72_15135 [Balneolaceae bacterium]|nr:hypothetical protein [Balneolaceae bacterium]